MPLRYGKATLRGQALDRRGRELLSAASRPIRLGEDQGNGESRIEQSGQYLRRERRRARETDAHRGFGPGSAGQALLLAQLAASRARFSCER